jgi:hypothetical protein
VDHPRGARCEESALAATLAGVKTVGRYQVLEEIGRGGMGVVYRALDPTTHSQVAVKVLLGDVGRGDVAARRLRREAEALARVEHPGVVRLIEQGEVTAGVPYVAMSWVEGESLQRELDRVGTLTVADAVGVGVQVCDALRASHAAGVLHRDLKPDNVLRAADGHLVLIDFGLARDTDPSLSRSALSVQGMFLGTPGYWSPEQARGDLDAIDARTDVFGVGATLFALLTGRVPHTGDSLVETLQDAARPKPPPSSLNPAVPPWLDRLVLEALAVDPAERFADCNQLLAALEAGAGAKAPAASRRARALAGGFLALGAGVAALLLARTPPGSAPSTGSPRATRSPLAAAEGSQVLALQPGPLLGVDTYVNSVGLYLNDNYGCDRVMRVGTQDQRGRLGHQRGYLRFELERLPPDAVVESALLELTSSDTVEIQLQARFVDPNTRPWVEGTSSRDESLDGVAWAGDVENPRDRRIDSDRPELDQPGFDPDEPPIDEVLVPEGETTAVFDLTVAVRAWHRGARANLGVCLLGLERDDVLLRRSFRSSDSPKRALRPKLVITYRGSAPLPSDEAAREARGEATAALILRGLEKWLTRVEPNQTADIARAQQALSQAIAAAPHASRGFAVRGRFLSQVGTLLTPRAHLAFDDFRSALRYVEPAQREGLRREMLDVLAQIEQETGSALARTRGEGLVQEFPDWVELREWLARFR